MDWRPGLHADRRDAATITDSQVNLGAADRGGDDDAAFGLRVINQLANGFMAQAYIGAYNVYYVKLSILPRNMLPSHDQELVTHGLCM